MENKTWDYNKQQYIETPNEMIEFFDEIEKVCKKYNLSISHQDGHGAFEIEKFSQSNIEWLKNAVKTY